jgi:hypothetical protein
MPAYSFKERFIPLIKSGDKTQTIRNKRKGQAKPGDTVYLYFGMRTKWCTKIGEGICTNVEEITIDKNGTVKINGKRLYEAQKYGLSIADGFQNWQEMLGWWRITNGLPFTGDIIYWTLKKQ